MKDYSPIKKTRLQLKQVIALSPVLLQVTLDYNNTNFDKLAIIKVDPSNKFFSILRDIANAQTVKESKSLIEKFNTFPAVFYELTVGTKPFYVHGEGGRLIYPDSHTNAGLPMVANRFTTVFTVTKGIDAAVSERLEKLDFVDIEEAAKVLADEYKRCNIEVLLQVTTATE